MIQNPIIYKQGGMAEPIYGTVVVSADSQTIEIPVSRLCSKCVLVPLNINRTITELDTNYADSTHVQISATNLPLDNANGFQYDGTALKKTSTKVLISPIAGSNQIGVTYFDFTSTKITISYVSADETIKTLSKGTYIYVAW